MAATVPKAKPATYANLCALPDNVIGEIVDGNLVVSRRLAPRHAIATSYIGIEVGGPYGRGRGGPGGWLILDEPELHLGGHVLVPDLAGWLRERKQDIYREQGVPWLCFVDPVAHTIEVLRLSGQDLIVAGTLGGDGEMRIPPFDAVAIDVGALWDSPPPSAAKP